MEDLEAQLLAGLATALRRRAPRRFGQVLFVTRAYRARRDAADPRDSDLLRRDADLHLA
jgi:hypothetical protein